MIWYNLFMTEVRKDKLTNGCYYHILNRSIAQYQIFKEADDCERFLQILDLYRYIDFVYKYSNFLNLTLPVQQLIIEKLRKDNQKMVKIIAYCIMPTHFHLILYQNENNGISKFIAKVLNSYSRSFNLRYKRKGPLWEGHFKNVLIDTDEQMLHLTRYIHLNPVSANLIKQPDKWSYSSYREYISRKEKGLCEFDDLIELTSKNYQTFVNDRINYQKELSKIKRLTIENYTN